MGQVRVGTSGWSYPEWVGPFYPEATSAARMLPFYAQSLQAVEAHSTHRRLPTPASLTRWSAQVPAEFRFAPKAHVGITHRRDTDGLADRVATFVSALRPLGERLGPVLFVLPHRQPDLERLDRLLAALHTAAVDAVFELGPAWWVDEVFDRLAGQAVSLALVDRDDDRHAIDTAVLGPVAYVRLRRTRYDEKDLDQWAVRLAAEADGERDAYAFVKHDQHGDGPRYARALVRRLERG